MTNADGGGPPPHETESIAVARDGWKLVDNVRRAAGQPEYELYNHRADPLNLVDLAAKEPQRVASLVKYLAAWRVRISAVHLESDETAGQHLSSEDLERLRSLGYVK
jgi:arylsulfatase